MYVYVYVFVCLLMLFLFCVCVSLVLFLDICNVQHKNLQLLFEIQSLSDTSALISIKISSKSGIALQIEMKPLTTPDPI